MIIQIEMFNKETKTWRTDIRIYQGEKSLDSQDLKDLPGLRRNAIKIQ